MPSAVISHVALACNNAVRTSHFCVPLWPCQRSMCHFEQRCIGATNGAHVVRQQTSAWHRWEIRGRNLRRLHTYLLRGVGLKHLELRAAHIYPLQWRVKRWMSGGYQRASQLSCDGILCDGSVLPARSHLQTQGARNPPSSPDQGPQTQHLEGVFRARPSPPRSSTW